MILRMACSVLCGSRRDDAGDEDVGDDSADDADDAEESDDDSASTTMVTDSGDGE